MYISLSIYNYIYIYLYIFKKLTKNERSFKFTANLFLGVSLKDFLKQKKIVTFFWGDFFFNHHVDLSGHSEFYLRV